MSRKSNIDKELDELLQGEQEFADAMGFDDLIELTATRHNTLVELGDGIIIDLAAIVRIDKERRFFESHLGNSRFQWGIVVNKDIQGKDLPNRDVCVWYEREEVRDAEYDKLRELLEQNGRQIIKNGVEGKSITVTE